MYPTFKELVEGLVKGEELLRRAKERQEKARKERRDDKRS